MDLLASALICAVVSALVADCLRTRAQPGTRSEWLALGVIVLAAIALRALWLAQSSLEHLEASYLFEAVKPDGLWAVVVSRQSAEQMHQPLFPLLMRGIGGLSIDEVALRLPSVLFTAACVPVVWTLVRDAVGRAEALQAAALAAAAPLMVWYGRDCSPYALLALLGLTAVASAHQAISTDSRRAAIRAGIALALAFYTHFHGGWIAVTVGLWMLAHHRRRFVDTTAICALLCLPWVGALLDKLLVSVQGLREDSPLMRYSHDTGEATTEALRVLLGSAWWSTLALVVAGALLLWRRGPAARRLGTLIAIAAGVGLVAELHIVWQLQRSKGILYVDVRHYIYLAPLLLIGVATLPRHVAAALVLVLQLWTSVPMVVSLEKPDVRSAVAWITRYADSPAHGVAFLPAPWYQPIVERYLTGICPGLVHGRSHEGWWKLDDCYQSDVPIPGALYGFPPDPDRLYASLRREELLFVWVIDIRDHRFGLPVPPTEPQERFHCWPAAQDGAVLERREFGPWVTVTLLDARRLRDGGPPPPARPPGPARTVTAAQAWELDCH